ncbi:MAG: hypothetical protein KatS3mg105_2897 [Gemmatales bacterium]|nr:MAG: hypothetical protein KatS3mg105_2897 [Gemmatales bacterium]
MSIAYLLILSGECESDTARKKTRPAPPLPPGQLLTGDHNLINIQVILVYSVVEDEVEDYVIQEPERVDEMVQRVGEAALAEWVAERTVDDVLLRDKAHLPKWLAQETQKRIQPYRLGIRIRNEASVAYLYPPDEVKAAFDRVTRALAKIETMRNRAEEEAVATIRQAEQYAFERLELAKAYKTTQKKLAEADAEIFHKRLAKYRELSRNNPDYLAAIWWNEMGQLFAQLKDNGQLDLLDKHLSGDGLDITLFPPMPGK